MPPGGSVQPNGRFLLDTNIVIALFAGEAAVVAARSRGCLAKIADFAAVVAVLSSDAATAVIYGN